MPLYDGAFKEREGKMKIKVKSIFNITLCVAIMMLSNAGVVAYAQEMNGGDQYTNIHVEKSGQEEAVLAEKLIVQPRATSTVWDATYTGEYNVKKSFTMATSLVSSGKKPFTTFTITNKGNSRITAVAYTGAFLGSKDIASISIPAKKTMSITVDRGDIVDYGTKSQSGDRANLSYTISLYNEDEDVKKISFSVKGIRYN